MIGAVDIAPMDSEALRSWVARASAGDSVVYARRQAAAAVLRTARLAAQRGLVTTHINRAPVSHDQQYVALRTATPFVPLDLGEIATPRQFLRTSPEARILRALTHAARRSRVCPNNLSLARAAGLTSGICASYRLRKLVRAGLIAIDHPGQDRPRIVTIVATGMHTAGVGGGS